jgi:RHS repeat-associated protein
MNKILKHSLKIISIYVISFMPGLQLYAQQERPLPIAYPAGTQVSFVRTWDATAPEQDPTVLMTRPLKDVKQATKYLDGLGRPLQTVLKQGSMSTGGSATDIVSPVVYDEFDREQYKYLPFAANNTGGNTSINDGAFKLNPFQQQNTFMIAQYGSQNEAFFYSKASYEASPLNEITDTYAPGISWMGSEANSEPQRRNVQKKYFSNTLIDEVRIWTVTDNSNIGQFGTYNSTGTYLPGELSKSITIDEHKKQVVEFKDKDDRVILKKVQLTATSDDGTGSSHAGWLCTYYIYDDFSNIRAVIQPEGVKLLQLPANNWQLSATLLAEQCFRYEYDLRLRMIVKQVPGAGSVYMVYDKRDRLVMTQDANMRQGTPKWLITKYDELNRPFETGLWNNNGLDFATHLATAAQSINYPTTTGTYEQLTLTHYDDYAGLPGGLSATYLTIWNSHFSSVGNVWPYPQAPLQSNAVKGLPTWTATKVLGTVNTYLYAVTIYDEKARPIQVQSTNITGGIDVVTTQYSWAGQPLVLVQKQDKQGGNAQASVVVTQIMYDDLGRATKVEKKLSNTLVNNNTMSAYKTIVQHEYDQLGQLKKKTLGSNNLETLNYDYNVRGWMLGMNRDYAKDVNSSNYFGFDLGFDKANNNIIGNEPYTNPQFNGNIEGTVWKSKGDGEKRKYDFGYDPANRLMKADFTQYTGGTFNQSAGVNFDMKMGDDGNNVISAYDDNGNIKRMQQWGWKLTGSVQIDNMRYTYIEGSNRLKSVTDFHNDPVTKLGDFKTNTAHPQNATKSALTINSTQVEFDAITDYTYDANGNLNLDNNKTISSITYNHLNLSTVITVTGKGTITYSYDAAGNKLKKETVDNSTAGKTITTTTTYIGGMVYESKTTSPSNTPNDDYVDRLQFIGHEEGRIRFKLADASFQYDYMIKDHLGNVRMVLTEEQQQDRYPAATLEDATYNGGTAVSIESLYYNIDNSKIVPQSTATGIPTYQNNNSIANPNLYSNTSANSNRLYLLNATNNTVADKNGLGIVLKVMAGDAINIWGKSYHKMPGSGYSSSTNPLSVLDLMTLLATSPAASGKGITGTQISGLPGFPTNVTNLLNNQPPQNSNRPRASINWVVLDEQFKYVSGGFDMVETAANTNGSFKDHSIQGIAIPKNGYIYVYCSNESQYNVFFDNLQVVHDKGPILEETHYYPFGLTMVGISSKAAGSLTTKYKFGSKEIQNAEFGNNSGIELYDFSVRNYDPQVGRWCSNDPAADKMYSYSPYNYTLNNPTLLVDPDGRIPIIPWIIKAAVGAAADLLAQATMSYLFDPKVTSWTQAFDNVNWWQVGRSGLEGLIPWRTPGGKIGRAAATAVGDVVANAMNNPSGYSLNQAGVDFATGFISDLAGGGFGELLSKYGAKNVAAGLVSKLGWGAKKVHSLTGVWHSATDGNFVGTLATKIGNFVQDIDVNYRFSGGSGDVDIMTANFNIEVKSGKKMDLKQSIKNSEFAKSQGKGYILYMPTATNNQIKEAQKNGFPLITTEAKLKEKLNEINRKLEENK